MLTLILFDSIHTDHFTTIDSNLAKYVRLLTIYLLDLINLCAT
ncbi:hypothetical protein VCHA50O413_20041 [Vibrio chagasii]|nr:hypothetical protein VCHA50O405_10041 [Vibrio chagasii]CAH7018646.1 hypothetical protein VCHA34P114_70042 [Vibrio chagasii]CAH7111209.1 hypothetical protein VCHA50O413_20041 [Vibrio chagasii]